MKIVLAGGSGQVGTLLSRAFAADGHQVIVLSRKPAGAAWKTVLWDAENRLVLCNTYFQRLHKLPDSAVIPGTSYETVLEVGRMPEVRTRHNETASQGPGARTFEAQLDDGSWLHISERRTKDGGYVSVGTDITRIKEHEQKLVDNDLRLRATVIDLKRSQAALERQTIELADLAEKYQREKTRAEEANQTK